MAVYHNPLEPNNSYPSVAFLIAQIKESEELEKRAREERKNKVKLERLEQYELEGYTRYEKVSGSGKGVRHFKNVVYNGKTYYPIPFAAKELGIKESLLRYYVRMGAIYALKIGFIYYCILEDAKEAVHKKKNRGIGYYLQASKLEKITDTKLLLNPVVNPPKKGGGKNAFISFEYNNKTYYSVCYLNQQVLKSHNVPIATFYNWLKQGKLESVYFKKYYYVTLESALEKLEKYLEGRVCEV